MVLLFQFSSRIAGHSSDAKKIPLDRSHLISSLNHSVGVIASFSLADIFSGLICISEAQSEEVD